MHGSIAVGLWVFIVFTQISGVLTIQNYESFAVEQTEFLMLKVWLPWLLLSPFVLWIAKKFPFSPENLVRKVLLHFGLFLALSLMHVSVISLHYHYFGDMAHDMDKYQPWQHIGHFLFGDEFFLFNLIIYTLFIASFNLRNFYTLAQKKQIESAQLNEQLSRTKLHALKMQINPHFLFNTLNVIQVLVMKKDNEKAAETLRRLSSFLRQTLDESDSQWVPLKAELEMIEQYMSIEQVRFGDRLVIDKDYEEGVMSTPVPSMILQPLVENAMRHGLGEKPQKGTLKIHTCKVSGSLIIEISDDGVGCNAEKVLKNAAGIGLNNVVERLQQMYGKQHIFDFKSAPGTGTKVTIEVPLTRRTQIQDENHD